MLITILAPTVALRLTLATPTPTEAASICPQRTTIWHWSDESLALVGFRLQAAARRASKGVVLAVIARSERCAHLPCPFSRRETFKALLSEHRIAGDTICPVEQASQPICITPLYAVKNQTTEPITDAQRGYLYTLVQAWGKARAEDEPRPVTARAMNDTPSTLREIAGRRIRDVRRQRRMSAAVLTKALGWPTETLINFEYGRRPLYLDRLEVIAQALNASLLVADADTVDTVALLGTNAELAGEVRFFLSTLSAEPQPLGDENDTPSPSLDR